MVTVTLPRAVGADGPPGEDGTNGVGVPAGGTDGQVLTKTSSTDYATAWETPSGGGGGVSPPFAISDTTGLQAALDAKAPTTSPAFTGTVTGITAAMVGLANVDNTADTAKPVSTAQQTALDLKAPLASPTFTGTVGGITKAMVGLGSVDNTSDAAKPVSTATQTALDLKAAISDTLNSQTGTTYTLQASDNGKVVELSNASAITLTAPSLSTGFNCIIRQTGAGQVTISPSGTTMRNRQSHTKLAGQWSEASIGYRTATEFVLSGDTTT